MYCWPILWMNWKYLITWHCKLESRLHPPKGHYYFGYDAVQSGPIALVNKFEDWYFVDLRLVGNAELTILGSIHHFSLTWHYELKVGLRLPQASINHHFWLSTKYHGFVVKFNKCVYRSKASRKGSRSQIQSLLSQQPNPPNKLPKFCSQSPVRLRAYHTYQNNRTSYKLTVWHIFTMTIYLPVRISSALERTYRRMSIPSCPTQSDTLS